MTHADACSLNMQISAGRRTGVPWPANNADVGIFDQGYSSACEAHTGRAHSCSQNRQLNWFKSA
jgi:hypothetical protein